MADFPTSVPSAHSAAVYRYAVELVEDTRRGNEARIADARELAAVVADQLARLTPAHRDVIIFRNLEGLAFNEVARRMNRTPGGVRVLWLRALEELRQLIREQEVEYPC